MAIDNSSTIVRREDIEAGLRELGLQNGDTVLVHSSLSSFGRVEGAENTIIDALLSVMGQNGLVMVPTHTWGTVNARQPVFHVSLSPSIVGRLTNTFRQKAGAVRSLHPTHSVAAIGRDAAEFVAGHETWSTPCAPNSPYGRLINAGGYVILLGVDLHVCTLIHGFEEWAGVPWLFDREEQLFTVLDNGGIIPVRSLRHTQKPGYDRNYPSLEPLLQEHNLIRYAKVGNATLRCIDAKGARDVIVPLLQKEPNAVLPSYSGVLNKR